MVNPVALIPRALTAQIDTLLADEPVVVLNGARTVGKSTLLRSLADRYGTSVMDLDDRDVRTAVAADPALFAAAPGPVLIDEFQKVPELLDAIKAELNRDLRPGRYVLTGSTRYTALPTIAQSLTGRVHVLDVWPLSQRELSQQAPGDSTGFFAQHLLEDPAALVCPVAAENSRSDYEQRVLTGGFPLAVRRTERARSRWFHDYVNLVIERDVLDIRQVRQRDALPRLLRMLAAQTGQVLNISRAAEQLRIDPGTARDYVTLLETVFLLYRLPAWGRNMGTRVTALPKIQVVDSGLAAYLSGVNSRRLAARTPAVLTQFGHLLETFAVNEIIQQGGRLDEPVSFAHFRTHDHIEVDLVVEAYDDRVAGVEVKASSRVEQQDLKGLVTLRDKLGGQFTGGVLLYTGSRAYTFDERIHVLPVQSLWTGPQG